MPQCRVLSTYGRHRQRKVSLVDWSQCLDNSNNISLFGSGEGDSLISTSTHAMCLRNKSKVEYGSDQFYPEDSDSYAEEIYESSEKENQRGRDSRKGKAKNKVQKNTKTSNASKMEKKLKPEKSEKPSVGLVEAFDSTKTGYRNRKKKKKTVGDLQDENERLCSFVNFSDIEKHSLIISDSPPIETDLQPVQTTPKKTNWNPCSAASEHEEQQLPVNASPIPVHCSTPHVDGLPTKSYWVEKEKPKMPTELYENVSFISSCMSHIQLSETNCSLLSNQNVNKDGHNAVNCSSLSGISHSDTSSLLRDCSLYESAKCEWSLTNRQGSDLATAPTRVDYSQAEVPQERTSVRKQRNRSSAELLSSSELFSVSSGDHSLKDKLRSFDESCVTDLSDIEPEEDASVMEDLAADDVRSSENEADDDVDMEDDEELLSSSSCLSRILEEDEAENDSPKNEHMASTSCVISRHESGCKDASSVLSTISYNQLQLMSESPKMLFTPEVQRDLVQERTSFLPHHQGGTPYLIHSSSDTAGICRENGFVTPRVKMPAYLQQALQKSARSIKEVLTPIRLPQLDRVPTFAEKVLSQCEQTQPCTFATVLPARVLKTCVKIGEGVYGEVFRVKQNSENVAFKIIPIEGLQLVNGEKQKTFEEILPEIVITKELSSLRHSRLYRTENFVHVKRVSLVQDAYPKTLIDQWDKYDSAVGSDNDRPDKFNKDQLFILFAFEDSGSNLESVELSNLGEVCSIITQVCMSLAIAERSLEFEHRDLHWGNVLIKPTDHTAITYILDEETKEVATNGLKVTIIDFTLSRLRRDDCTVFTDLSSDETLFTGQGDYQFDIYRLMKEETGNDWEPHRPFTNVLWIHYLMDKLVNSKDYREGKNPQLLRQSRMLLRSILNYESASDLISDCSFFHDK